MPSYPHSFPLRLSTDLSNTLHSASISTGITKSDIIRMSINKFLSELNASGVNEALAKLKGF
jgi:predicted DNA-binding protein